MAVLSDQEIFEELMKKSITIHPILDARQIQGAKIDLRLGNDVYLIKHFEQPGYDPRDSDQKVDYGELKQISFCEAKEKKGFYLQPGDFAIAPLFERVRLPAYIMGRLDGRSSLGRLGIVIHATAGGIDPGYAGLITCELSNLGKVPVAFYPLERIASLILERLPRESISAYRKRADGKYGDKLTTLIKQDKEFTSEILDLVARRL